MVSIVEQQSGINIQNKKALNLFTDKQDKEYLVCLINNNDETIKEWEIFNASEYAYDFIKESIDEIDLGTSFVLVSGMKLENAISALDFIKMGSKVFNDIEIDPETYYGNSDDEDKIDIDRMFYHDNNSPKPLMMSDLMSESNTRLKE